MLTRLAICALLPVLVLMNGSAAQVLAGSDTREKTMLLAAESAFCVGVLPLRFNVVQEYLKLTDLLDEAFKMEITNLELSFDSARTYVHLNVNSGNLDIETAVSLTERGAESYRRCRRKISSYFEDGCYQSCTQDLPFPYAIDGHIQNCENKCGWNRVVVACARPDACTKIHERLPF